MARQSSKVGQAIVNSGQAKTQSWPGKILSYGQAKELILDRQSPKFWTGKDLKLARQSPSSGRGKEGAFIVKYNCHHVVPFV